MESTNTMMNFIEVLQHNPEHAYDFISNNHHKMNKVEIVSITKELLYGIYNDCSHSQIKQLLNEVAVELDEQYNEDYQRLYKAPIYIEWF
jgi:hypothetical protein